MMKYQLLFGCCIEPFSSKNILLQGRSGLKQASKEGKQYSSKKKAGGYRLFQAGIVPFQQRKHAARQQSRRMAIFKKAKDNSPHKTGNG